MKLFSRKALAAVVTTVALTTAGVSAPAFAEDSSPDSVISMSSELSSGSSSEDADETDTEPESGSSISDMDPDVISDWIGVFTAVIGAATTVFVFYDKFMSE